MGVLVSVGICVILNSVVRFGGMLCVFCVIWYNVVWVGVVYRAVAVRLQQPGWLALSHHSICYGHHGVIRLGWDLGQVFPFFSSAPFYVIRPCVQRSIRWLGVRSISRVMRLQHTGRLTNDQHFASHGKW